jgi:hypothetical protein
LPAAAQNQQTRESPKAIPAHTQADAILPRQNRGVCQHCICKANARLCHRRPRPPRLQQPFTRAGWGQNVAPCRQKTLTNQTPPATRNMLAAPERNILGGTAFGGSPAGNHAPGIEAEILLALAKRLERKARPLRAARRGGAQNPRCMLHPSLPKILFSKCRNIALTNLSIFT